MIDYNKQLKNTNKKNINFKRKYLNYNKIKLKKIIKLIKFKLIYKEKIIRDNHQKNQLMN